MATTIITKNNATAGVAPSAGQLVQGELAVNVVDKKLYTLNALNQVVLISSGSDYDVPVTVDVNSASTAVTIDQAGSGGGLRITNTGAGNSLLIEDSANPDSTPFVVDASGKLIVGALTPTTLASSIPAFQANTASITPVDGISWFNGATANFGFGKSRSGAIGTNGIVSNGDGINLDFRFDDGLSFVRGAQVRAEVDGTPGTGDMPGRLVFSTTADGAAIPTERLRITSTGALAIAGAANYGTAGQALVSAGNAAPAWTDQFLSITFLISGGGSTVATGIAGDLTVPFNCTITEWTLLADQTGSVVIDIWKDTYANYPPTVADTITGSAKPTISAGVKGQSSTLTGWTTTISAGDTLRFNVDSAAAITRVTLSLKVKRT